MDGRKSVERVCCISLPQSAVLTAPSSEGAVGNGGMREGRGARGVMGGGWRKDERRCEECGGREVREEQRMGGEWRGARGVMGGVSLGLRSRWFPYRREPLKLR